MIRSKQLLLFTQLLLSIILCRQALSFEISEDTFSGHGEMEPEVPRESNAEGSTLAHDFAQNNQIFELIDIITDDRELLNVKDINGWTPLHEAARNGNVVVVSFLVENGADVLAKTVDGDTARDLLHDEAVLSEQEDDAIKERYNLVQTILMHAEDGQGIDGHTIKKKKSTDDIVTHFGGLSFALVQLQLLPELNTLRDLHEDIAHEYDAKGWTTLHEAARVGNSEIISFLVEHGGKITDTTIDGRTPLDIAEEYAEEAGTTEHIDLIKSLIEEENNPKAEEVAAVEGEEF